MTICPRCASTSRSRRGMRRICAARRWMRCRDALGCLQSSGNMTVTRMYVNMTAQDASGTYRSLLDGM